MKFGLLISAFVFLLAGHLCAQQNPNEYQEEKPVLLRNEASFGIVIHSSGFGIEGKRSFQQTYKKKWLLETQLVGMKHPKEIKTIGSSLLAINQTIEKLRSEKTNFHGKTNEDYLINDTIYTYFIINTVATVGLFLNSYYKTKFPVPTPVIEDDRLPF